VLKYSEIAVLRAPFEHSQAFVSVPVTYLKPYR
jgi:hypothetical protein